MSHAVISHFHPDIALWNLAGFVVHPHNRAERYSLQLYLSRLFPLLIIAIFFVTYHHAVSLFFATNVGHRPDRQGRAMSAEKISTLQVVFMPTVFGRTLLVVILGTAILVA